MSETEKQYGLIQPKTAKKLTIKDVFGNDDDEDNNDDDNSGIPTQQGANWVKKVFQREVEKGLKQQIKLEMQKALQEDPTVYQYDEVYDNMVLKKQETDTTKVTQEKKPKYIQNLLKTADRRKKENERRMERQIQKEREAEGEMYKDKEEFITSSYKQKLEEFKKADEQERKMEYIESIMDVTKQQDLGGFYRHMYKETVTKGSSETTESKAIVDVTDVAEPLDKVRVDPAEGKLIRNFRKRENSGSPEAEGKKSRKKSSSSSSDSDSSSDSSSSTSSSEDEKEVLTKVDDAVVEGQALEALANQIANQNEKVVISEVKKDDVEIASKLDSKNGKDGKTGGKNGRHESAERGGKNYRRGNYRDRSPRDRFVRERERRGGKERRDRGRRDELEQRGRHRNRERRSSRSRRRSRTPDRRKIRQRSRERSHERNRTKRQSDRDREAREVRGDGIVKDKQVKEPASNDLNKSEETPDKMKPSIWEKRTIGAVLETAIERFYLRKASRGC